jgi:FkbM family methyltransferase
MIYRLKKFIHRRYNISFSKSGDDIQLMKMINNYTPGAYVDIGSWHPIKSSNSYYFHLRNWKGICIDPNPQLKSLYDKLRPNDIFINAAVGTSKAPLNYYMIDGSSMNSFSYEFILKNNLKSRIVGKKEMPFFSLKEILDKNLDKNDRLDFFDVDVEGYDLDVLKSNDWNIYRPKVVVVESDSSIKKDLQSDIVKYLELQEYKVIGKSVINGNLGNLFLISN